MIGAAVVAGVVAGVAAIYGTKDGSRNQESAACPGSAAVAAKMDPLAKGQIAALNVSAAPQPLPPISFQRADGTSMSLADFKGRTVLLNLWATWCVPCRREMPALNKLEGDLGGKDFEVVAVNIDTRNADRVAAFLDDNKIDRLARYADPSTGILQSLKDEGLGQGLPTSVVIDRQGCRLAAMAGPAEWASDEAKAVIKAATGL
ncbi:thiol-disulfide isomerase/thioredoxin [Labrys monachus]|uniref:Thiol-disulfide isomerase/thioredoxin n=1 Tax=Labrys monachus TaxID=217067 RepID=A0ABU0FNI2_9HYPH|nr:TlpA disulfide reductase family protein [Labrys monachus]MDQ0396176.1 thiol-disulfide isomerase/thioredoxin [Labrys monachus]